MNANLSPPSSLVEGWTAFKHKFLDLGVVWVKVKSAYLSSGLLQGIVGNI